MEIATQVSRGDHLSCTARRFGVAAAAVLAVALGFAPSASAQVVSGRIVEQATGAPVQAAFVRLLDEAGTVRTAVLADSTGGFLLRAPGPGRYRLSVERIGFEGKTTSPFDLAAGAHRSERVEMPDAAIRLAGIDVDARRQCHLGADEGSAIARVWGEAQKALEVVAWTRARGATTYEVSRFERVRELHGQVILSQRQWTSRGTGEHPFVALSAGQLLRGGFLQKKDGAYVYYGPSAAVLLADEFLGSHCFSLRRGEHGEIGIAFEPAPGVDRPDIDGVLWLDPTTDLLRTTDFHYTGDTPLASEASAGGHVEYEQRPDGAWIIRSWTLHAPIKVVAGGVHRTVSRLPTAMLEAGGRIVGMETTTEKVGNAGEITGTVYDRTRAAPLAGARVYLSGTALAAVSDSAGRFRLDHVPAGRYMLGVEPPAGDSLAPSADDSVVVRDGALAYVALELGVDGTAPAAASAHGPLPAAVAAYDSAVALLRAPPPGRLPVDTIDGLPVRLEMHPTFAEIAARMQLERAVALDSGYAAPALELAELALELRDGSSVEHAERALRGVVSHGGATTRVWTTLADVELARGELRLAEAAARSALGGTREAEPAGTAAPAALAKAAAADAGALAALNAADVAPAALHALAVALLRTDGREEAGAAVYVRGLARVTGAGAAYSRDALPLFTADELRAWEAAQRADSVGAWLTSFWKLRAARSGATVARVLAVHQRRLAEAERRYRHLTGQRAKTAGALMLDTNPLVRGPFDDRGLVFLRYGEPTQIIRTTGNGLAPNEAWLYAGGAGDTPGFDFVKPAGSSDFYLVGDPFAVLDPYPTNLEGALRDLLLARDATEPVLRYFQDRLSLGPAYAHLYQHLQTARLSALAVKMGSPSRTAVADFDDELTSTLETAQRDQSTRVQAAE